MGIIICDLDDVIADTERVIVKYAKVFNREVLHRDDEKEYDGFSNDYFYFASKFQWGEKEVKQFFSLYYPHYLKEVTCINECRSYMNKIVKLGHEFYIVSARYPNEKNVVYQLTEEWLLNNHIPFTELWINQQDKTGIVNMYPETFAFIDDSEKNCSDIWNYTHCKNVFLFEKDYNHKCCSKNYHKVKNWSEIYENICDL